MSCYIHHLTGLFAEAGLEYDKANRKAADERIRALIGLPDAHCPEVWRAVKPMLADPEGRARLLAALRPPGL
jgi:hypothetical protein